VIPEQYVWLVWASAFLVPWLGLFLAFPRHRRAMWWASLFTAPFGLTEPLFVPEYWNPPSLFDLAQRTGFDLESLVFCFGIGGVGAVLYNVIGRKDLVPLPAGERHAPAHRFHRLALLSPFFVFALFSFWSWNPIYPGILAMAGGAAATIACRRDLARKTWLGGLLFVAYYVVFLAGLELTSPGYIERVWNLDALTGLRILGMPIEELLFATTFGMYWSGVYEHYTWLEVRDHTSSTQVGGELDAERRPI
jgi:hypothetical protein